MVRVPLFKEFLAVRDKNSLTTQLFFSSNESQKNWQSMDRCVRHKIKSIKCLQAFVYFIVTY